MKKYLWIMALCLCFAKGNAQGNADARKVLDATAAQVTGQGGVKARFKADSFTDGNLQGSVSGTMCLQGEKFRMDTPEMVTWYNGETQWSYVKANEEVNVSVPTPEERQAMNPYAFVHLYKEGYGLALKETVLRGKPCYEVTLADQSGQKALRTIILDIDRRTSVPMCVRMQRREDGQWTRIAIHQFCSGQAFDAADFEFSPADYPQAEVIDLR